MVLNSYLTIMPAKLTRKEIQEGIKQVPIERILLGATNPANIKLTKKQKAFAEQVVETGNKTEAYRRAYNTNGKRTTAAPSANKLSKNPNVNTYIMALNAAKSVEEYLLPARLRSMAIHKLSQLALSDDIAPAQQLKALELVGKMTEVALFTERRELVHTMDSDTLKVKLMEAVQLAIANSKGIRQTTKRSAAELLAELTNQSEPEDIEYIDMQSVDMQPLDSQAELESISELAGEGHVKRQGDDPTEGHPPFFPNESAAHLHSIPHNQSSLQTGGGDQFSVDSQVGSDMEKAPLVIFDENGEGGIQK